MRGGTQPQLLRCGDGGYYVVKFANNPQHPRVLANEWVAAALAREMGLPVPAPAVVEVPGALVEHSAEMVMDLPRGRTRCRPGRHFGSRYPGDPARAEVCDFLPDGHLARVENVSDFLGMLVFDRWTCNTDERQVVFHRSERQGQFRVLMIDHGCCFGGAEWSFPDAPPRGLYTRAVVYESATGPRSFEPWLSKLERGIREEALYAAAAQMPPEWYDSDRGSLDRLVGLLWRRRNRVRELLSSAAEGCPHVFPNWEARRSPTPRHPDRVPERARRTR